MVACNLVALKIQRSLFNMISVKYSDIPQYLHCSDFYQALNPEDSEEDILVPEDSFKYEDSANNIEEFAQLIRAVRFWGIKNIPVGICDFCLIEPFLVWGPAAASALSCPSQLTILDDLRRVFEHVSTATIDRAMEIGRTEIVTYLITTIGPPFRSTAADTAVRIGRLDYLQLLLENGYDLSTKTCSMAASCGDLECLVYLRKNGCPWNVETYINSAHQGNLNCMKYAYENGLAWRADVCTEAVRRNHLHILRFAHEHGCPWDENVTLIAASDEYQECLRYALHQGCAIHKDSVKEACKIGNIELITLLHEYNAPWDTDACDMAAGYGHLEILQYLHENHCPWNKSTTDRATSCGELATLEYAMSNGCPRNENIFRRAATCGNLDCLQYLAEQIMCMDENGLSFGAALKKGHFDCLEYLLDTNYSFMDYEFCDATDNPPIFAPSACDSDFHRSMVLALERGWRPNKLFIEFVQSKNIQACDNYLVSEGYL